MDNPLKKCPVILCCLLLASCLTASAALKAEPSATEVTVRPTEGEARVVRLQAVGDAIIRVRATSEPMLPEKRASLVCLPQTTMVKAFSLENDTAVGLSTGKVTAWVSKRTGRITFHDASGRVLLSEKADGKRFRPYRVSSREIGVDSSRVTEAERNALSWQLAFEPNGDALYGLGQHQSEELNMRGRNEDLFQYNTKVSIPFVISNRGYGILWDAYSYCRFGHPENYRQLHRAFRLYDKEGREGSLTGTYTDRNGKTLVRQEDSLYFEYDLPSKQQANDPGGIKNLPRGFRLDGSKVVYEGYIVPQPSNLVHQPSSFNPQTSSINPQASSLNPQPSSFLLYYAGYVKVFIGDSLVVPERWRTAWNPNSYKFTAYVPQGVKTPIRIEWQPDGSVSYLGLRATPPSDEDDGLTLWSEMARDMDYYFIAGETMDEVIGGYRTLTGRAPVYPKWALGYWQSRERYKTQDELLATLAEFRHRHLPIDNIVQDWNYWPEDQWGSHRFESARYPDPQAMIDSVHALHGRFMLSVWPKFYKNTDHYRAFDAQGWMYRQAVADSIRDWVGPGYIGSFYDAYSPAARRLFWQQMDSTLYTGLSMNKSTNSKSPDNKSSNRKSPNKSSNCKSSNCKSLDAWWMDASEPNVRDCTPMWYRKALCGPTALGTSTEFFNAYALVNAQAIYEGQRSMFSTPSLRMSQGEVPRVFLLTRSGFAGMQRYSAATWSGDIGTRWEDMRAQMTAGLNYSLSGLPFWGMDIGGFCVENRYVKAQRLYDKSGEENDDLREWRELQTRWLQFGAFVPLFRTHGQWPLREPWNIAPDDHPAYRSFVFYDRLRYRLMPYLYSMAGWTHLRHYTMMRALAMDFPNDRQVLDLKDQWMFGPSLMVCPVGEYKARQRNVYFPPSRRWYDLYTGGMVIDKTAGQPSNHQTAQPGNRQIVQAPYDRIPVFVPDGSIIAFGPDMEWSDEKQAGLIHLYIYGGRDAQFTLYEDEGTNYNYERGQYATIDIRYSDADRTLTIGARQGSFPGMLQQRRFAIVLVTPDSPQPLDPSLARAVTITYEGQALTLSITH